MTALLLSIHVLLAIVSIGPVAIASSMFPPAVRAAGRETQDPRRAAVVGVLHRITRVYAVIGVAVPIFGIATAASLGVLFDAWLLVSMALTAGAAVLLIAQILPLQRRSLASLDEDGRREGSLATRLSVTTGVFNLVWVIVVVLMIYRPGSTTGV